MIRITVFMVYYQVARAVLSAVSITNVVTSFLNLLFIVLTQQRHFIIPPFRFVYYLSLCYNAFTYKSPPVVIMTAGGLEPPRQFPASSCQDYCVCQLHHAVVENIGEGKSLPADPSPKSHLKNIPKHGHLSIGKTTYMSHNTIMRYNNDMS